MLMKVYCRIYQLIMKIGMVFLPWRMPQVIKGAGVAAQIPSFVKEKGFHKVLIVTGKNLLRAHVLDTLLENCDKEQLAYVIFDEIEPNPTDVNVEKGVAFYMQNRCEAIIAIGGGSKLDCAKAIGARIARPDKSIAQLQGLFKIRRRIPEIFTVPTTAGTGSETTIAAVITDSKTHHKASINDLVLMPRYAFLDPKLTVGLSPATTAITGLDALSHAVEAYTNNTYNSSYEKQLCLEAVKLIYENLYALYLDGSDLKGRENLQLAAFYAGRAFTRGSVGYVHAIGHTLGGLYGTPHGLAMGILLPHVMRQYGKKASKRLAELCDACGLEVNENTSQAKTEAFIAWMEDLKVKMNIPLYPEYQSDDLDQIVKWAYQEGNPLYPTPVTWSKKEFKDFLLSLK